MVLFFIFFGVMSVVFFLLRTAIQRLADRKGEPWVAALNLLYTVLFYGGPLAVVAYLVFFVSAIPRPISITGGAVSYVFFLLLLNFNTAQKQAREAKRATMLSLLRQHIKARKIEKQVKEWNENYGI